MGSCLSKKTTNAASSSPPPAPAAAEKKPAEENKSSSVVQVVEKKKKVEEETVKKEIFIIKHRKSHEIDRKVGEEKCEVKKGCEVVEMAKNCSNNGGVLGLGPGSGVLVAAAPVRTSSCTKEEVDAILIQCGRLSRSSSTGKTNLSASIGSGENGNGVPRGRKYSGSKRSYDFDHENGSEGDRRRGNNGGGEVVDGCEENVLDDDNVVAGERSNRHRQRQRQSRSVGSPSKGRRRTPSRERDQQQQQQQQQQRSGSRERGSNGSGRRVSRSPGRRSESPIITTSSGVTGPNSSSAAANNANNGNNNRPGKMVSVPATVSSLAMDKSNNAEGGPETISGAAVKRIQVKRNAGSDAASGTRTAASPRARSPARTNVRASNDNQNVNSIQIQQQQPVSLSRSNSRKAEHSPYRRNPLGEIDTNIVSEQIPLSGLKVHNNNLSQQAPASDSRISKGILDKNIISINCKEKEQQNSITEEEKILQQAMNNNVAVNVVGSGPEFLKPHGVTRSRSSRLSRDLDINPEALSNPAPSYTALLLEDIQNFHQKNNTPAFTLPACVSKACSILEAVADLNSSISSNMSSAFPDDKRRTPIADQFNKLYDNSSFGGQLAGKKGLETKEPFLQSEVVGGDDLMEPSFHKYVTVRRGTLSGEDMEEQESSGSNSIAGGGPQHWASSSSWEPNSADSIDCWTSSSRSNCREDSRSPVPFQRLALSEPGYEVDEARRRLSVKKRDSDQQQNGIGRGRIGSRGLQSLPTAAAAASN